MKPWNVRFWSRFDPAIHGGSLAVLITVILATAQPVQAALETVRFTVQNRSRVTVRVTVTGFRGQTRTVTLTAYSRSWSDSVTSADGTCTISAAGRANSIVTRISTGQSRVIEDDRRAGYIRWAR